LTTVHDQYLVCGNQDGTIRFYDFFFKVVSWFEDMHFNTIKSISFSKTEPRLATNDFDQEIKDPFKCSDFLVADESSLVCMLQSTIFEEIEPSKKKGRTVFMGLKSSVCALAVHPKKPWVAIAGAEGFILMWDYMKKGDPIFSNFDLISKDEPKNKEKKEQVFTTLAFTPEGDELLIGQANGII